MKRKSPVRKHSRKHPSGKSRSVKRSKRRSITAVRSVASKKLSTARRQVVVTVDDAHLRKIQDLAGQLRSKGMHVDEVLEGTGQVVGTYPKKKSALKRVPGVSSVEEPPSFQLPPPDSDVQ